MASSPRTPRHSRHPSSIDAPHSFTESSPRRYSKASMHSPIGQSFARSDFMNHDVFSSGGQGAAQNGLGNLADELAGEWGEEDEEGDSEGNLDLNFQDATPIDEEGQQGDSGVDVASFLLQEHTPKVTTSNLTPPLPTNGRGHRRQPSEYDGSDYGGDSDLESPGMPPGLVARMDQVEGLARRGTENNGSVSDGVVKRVIDGLKDLGSQSGVEGNATRLITAHSALATHLLHQTRLLQSLSYPLFSPLTAPPDDEFIDDLIPLLITIGESMPRPTAAAFNSLTQLHTSTTDLVQTLNYLSDTLHMSRQTTTTATRRLRSAKELVSEMRKEEDAREEGERWLTRHNWGERLGKRECAAVCGDVVGGFEEVCNGWRDRLVAQAEAVGA